MLPRAGSCSEHVGEFMGSQVPENVLYTLSCTHPASSKYSLSTAHTVTHTVGVPGEQEKEIQLAQDTLSLRGGGKFLGGPIVPHLQLLLILSISPSFRPSGLLR